MSPLDEVAAAEPAAEVPRTAVEGVPAQIVVSGQDPESLSEQEQESVAQVSGAVAAIREQAEAIQVRTAAEAEAAAELLTGVKRAQKDSETARLRVTKPLYDHWKFLNDQFKPNTEALGVAENVVKAKVGGYWEEQDRVAREAQEKLEAEAAAERAKHEEAARKAEAEAREERERAAREAEQAAAEQRRIEREQAEADAKLAGEAADKCRALGVSQLVALGDGPDQVMAAAAEAELDRRDREHKAEQARLEAEAASRREEAAREREEAAREAPVPDVPKAEVVQQTTIRGGGGSVNRKLVWKATVEDPEKVPRRFLVVDEKAINRAVKDGERTIPGVKIEQVPELAVRTT